MGRLLHQYSPGQAGAGRPGGIAAVALGPSRVGPPQGESGVPDLAVPGTGVMEVGGVSIAPARRFVPVHARPAVQLPHRVPVELHPGTRGTAALRFECSFPWGCGADRPRDSLLPARLPGEEAAARCGGLSCLPMCAGFSVAQKELGGSPEPVYPPGPPTVDTNSSDSILPSLAQMAPRRHSP